MTNKCVLVTGGAGFIGSHTVLELLCEGTDVVVIDNLCNSSRESLRRVEKLAAEMLQRSTPVGKAVPTPKVHFYETDLLDMPSLMKVFGAHSSIACVIHFAGLKAVGESVSKPLMYYQTNVAGTLNLLQVMTHYKVKNLIFSSSATVYGEPEMLPLNELCRTGPTNPYGRTKFQIEEILQDLGRSDREWRIVLLRYFNPVGAHSSGMIGEDPLSTPNNLMPFVSQVAIGMRPCVNVFGDDYPTKDGTGVRDYIHVVDLALGHLAAMRKLDDWPEMFESDGCLVYNLGTGKGYSVFDMIKCMSKASGRDIKYKVTARRPGDVANVYADPSKAANELGWVAKRSLQQMCEDLWRWQSQNPKGFRE